MKKILFQDNKNVVSKRIKSCRLKAGLTQGQLAAKMQVLGVNLDQQMVSRIENNTRFVTDYELACFARAQGVGTGELLADFYDNYG